MAADLPLTKVAETATTVTLGWTPPVCLGYVFYRNGVRVSNTWDPAVKQAKFKKGDSYRVTALTAAAEGVYPAVVTPPVEPPVEPPSSAWPASYLTGPLGSSNILPAAPGKRLLIEYYGGGGVSWKDPGDTRSCVNVIPQREAAIGRKFDGIQFQYWGGGNVRLPDGTDLFGVFGNELAENRIQWIHDRGQIPVVSWSPYYSIAQINAGAGDKVYAYMADYLKQFPYRIMLRNWWEFDNNPGAFPWCVGNTADIGAPFVTAWKRVVNIFKNHGANNVGWWWCPLEGGDRLGVNRSYPGDAYVDWVGSDVYNTCFVNEMTCWQGPGLQGWQPFDNCGLYGPSSQFSLWSPKKPFVWGEVGCVYDPLGTSTLKGDWFRGLPAQIAAKGNLAAGVSFFDQDVTGYEGGKANWLVDYPITNPDVMAGFKQMAQALV